MFPSLLGVSADEASGRLLDLDLSWGRGALERLREQLFDETDALARVRLLENEVARRASYIGARTAG